MPRARIIAARRLIQSNTSINSYLILSLAVSLAHSTSAHANSELSSASALANLSLEQLSNMEVTSVSKSAQNLRSAAAAITVVTNEDIHRSGATSIPEALRFVPGINVARQSSNQWAVSARGFSSVNSEKLLVLSDTRSVYTPLFSGVFWDVQDYLLEDIDRIEVIRGPGAALWGSNAVNGVINITTKKAQDTQGLYVETALGTEDKVTAAARYGGTAENGASYRIFGKYLDRDDTLNATATSADDWRLGHAGARTDWDITGSDSVTVQGDLYRGTIGELTPSVNINGRPGPTGALDIDVSGGNVLGRWRHQIDDSSNFVLRAYYDNTHRNNPSYLDDLNTVDLDFQHQFDLTAQQQFIWGVNYHLTENRNIGKVIFNVNPDFSRDQLFGLFVQDQIALADSLHLTLGSKFEHNDFSGYETQPSARLAWDFAATQTLWTAVSRAVRVPTRLERDIAIDVTDPTVNPLYRWEGNKHFDAEVLEAYEIGYRWQARDDVALDLAAFHNHYSGLVSLEFGTPYRDAVSGFNIIPVVDENKTSGTTQGVEAQITYVPFPVWHLLTNYSYLDMQLDPSGLDINHDALIAGATPRHQLGLRSLLDLPADIQFDIQLRYLSAVRHMANNGDGISAYGEMDMRLAKRLSKKVEVSLVGQNLLHDHHVEFGAPATPTAPAARGEIQRGVYAKITWGI
ncbi:MAG TPA: TonB-dependent receptor [Spongiibacteraceae bacterium]